MAVRHLQRKELLERKAALEQALDILLKYTVESVCAELGEISYLLEGQCP